MRVDKMCQSHTRLQVILCTIYLLMTICHSYKLYMKLWFLTFRISVAQFFFSSVCFHEKKRERTFCPFAKISLTSLNIKCAFASQMWLKHRRKELLFVRTSLLKNIWDLNRFTLKMGTCVSLEWCCRVSNRVKCTVTSVWMKL